MKTIIDNPNVYNLLEEKFGDKNEEDKIKVLQLVRMADIIQKFYKEKN